MADGLLGRLLAAATDRRVMRDDVAMLLVARELGAGQAATPAAERGVLRG